MPTTADESKTRLVETATPASEAVVRIPGSEPLTRSPADDGWSTEAWSEQASEQLHRLADRLEQQSSFSAADVEFLAAEEFQGGPLVPGETSVVFADANVQVRRASVTTRDASENTASSPFLGHAGCAAVLSQLVAPLHLAHERHCKFKIFRVTPTEQGISAEIMLQMSGVAPDSRIQQSAVWHTEWTNLNAAEVPRLRSVVSADYERSDLLATDRPWFADRTQAVLGSEESFQRQLSQGLDYWLHRLEVGPAIVASSYHGLTVGDANGDGLDDLYVCQPGGTVSGLPNRLYLQQPDGTARDVSSEAGVDWLVETASALFVDIDNDGDQDLIAATMVGVVFAENDGAAHFSVRVVKALPEAPPLCLAAADYDGDGDLDLYAGCYVARPATQLVGRPVPYHDANNGARNVLLRNDGDFRFAQVTRAVGLDENNRRFTMACAWEDFDNDGDLDLYVANDYGRNNLYRNDNGQFHDVAAELGVEDLSAGMSVTWGDANHDGWLDLYVSNMWSSAGNRVAYQRRFLDGKPDDNTRAQFQRHARGNSLFLNRLGDAVGAFEDVSEAAAVTMGRWAWSSRFADINNDGWDDVLVGNGYITQDDTGDL
ncbi:MAG: VCBS repeat-containing protein [Planctomycetales bacterium]|nr:VCBS repeat-containing protein [Planctomycetales bacterium]